MEFELLLVKQSHSHIFCSNTRNVIFWIHSKKLSLMCSIFVFNEFANKLTFDINVSRSLDELITISIQDYAIFYPPPVDNTSSNSYYTASHTMSIFFTDFYSLYRPIKVQQNSLVSNIWLPSDSFLWYIWLHISFHSRKYSSRDWHMQWRHSHLCIKFGHNFVAKNMIFRTNERNIFKSLVLFSFFFNVDLVFQERNTLLLCYQCSFALINYCNSLLFYNYIVICFSFVCFTSLPQSFLWLLWKLWPSKIFSELSRNLMLFLNFLYLEQTNLTILIPLTS